MARDGLQLGFAAVNEREIRRGVQELARAMGRSSPRAAGDLNRSRTDGLIPFMSTRVLLVILGAVAAWNAVTWAVYRLDKARAGRAGRRISEHTLLLMAALAGSPGALIAVHAHRWRHKTRKASFVVPLWLIAAAHAALLAGLAWLAWKRSGGPSPR
jgi:uncharacterized membrane protein YsdA (DUF1294 family)